LVHDAIRFVRRAHQQLRDLTPNRLDELAVFVGDLEAAVEDLWSGLNRQPRKHGSDGPEAQ
jgi:hypothetical protein